jgi:hypothetical protein
MMVRLQLAHQSTGDDGSLGIEMRNGLDALV